MKKQEALIIGGGLSGAEAAFYLLKKGYEVTLYERKYLVDDGAHTSEFLGELVCSNSLKSKESTNACGLLKEEIRRLHSLMMKAASYASVPGGNALTVDRDLFAKYIHEILSSFPSFHLKREEVKELPSSPCIIATGPLTSGPLLDDIAKVVGQKNFSFFDASAPIVAKDSLDFSKVYYKSRFKQDDGAYLNCPFSKDEYFRFVDELIHAEKAPLHSFDTKYFEGCLPIEVMASRGVETLRHGMLKPFGLGTDEHPKPYAVAQLRQDNKLGDYYNLVGFQTNLTYPEQKRVFSLIPGLENARFIRYGLMHRNSYIDAPAALLPDLSLKERPDIYIAGQLSGVEGYVESAMMGLIAAINFDRKYSGKSFVPAPTDTMSGALIDYILHANPAYFAPMNANWALFPNSSKKEREATVNQCRESLSSYIMALDE